MSDGLASVNHVSQGVYDYARVRESLLHSSPFHDRGALRGFPPPHRPTSKPPKGGSYR